MADLESLSREDLIAVLRDQQQLIAELRAEIERLKRSQHGSAAPFSKGQRKSDPQRPGRKPGQGPFLRRGAPAQGPSETVMAQLPANCPACGGPLQLEVEEVATITELPVNPQPVVTAYRVPLCRCQQCGKRVRGTAPGLAADQTGATAHRVGPGVMAAAHALHYGVGIPVRKVPSVLRELTGVSLTQSAVTQDGLRRAAGPVGAAYEKLRCAVGEAPVVYSDDTGWRVGGQAAFLMGFDTEQASVYQIRPRHRNQEVREIVPGDYQGLLVSDRGKSYDAEELAGLKQQKCLSHLLRNVTDVVESKQGRARQFGATLKVLLRAGLTLWHARGDLCAQDFQSRSRQLNQQLTHHLRIRVLLDGDNQRLLDGIGLQQNRGRLLRFLEVEGVEPANNRAERMLRPAVIARKVSQCSKNKAGADAFAAFLSVTQTIRETARTSISQGLLALFLQPSTVSTR